MFEGNFRSGWVRDTNSRFLVISHFNTDDSTFDVITMQIAATHWSSMVAATTNLTKGLCNWLSGNNFFALESYGLKQIDVGEEKLDTTQILDFLMLKRLYDEGYLISHEKRYYINWD
jgi:hypothetical protein